MENYENKYLQKTLTILKNKFVDNNIKLQSAQKELKGGVEYLSNNLRDLAGGDATKPENAADLASYYNQLDILENKIKDCEKNERRLNLQIKNPYFARIDFKPNGKANSQQIYIGLGNIIENDKLYVADWRAPISSMYYDYNLGEAEFKIDNTTYRGDIQLKRQYKIENSNLMSYFDTDMTINDEILQDILSKNVSTKMKQIVSSIQKEQNVVVRSSELENVLVQGIAGSGKTSIALHRAAYLLYRYKNQIQSSDICIVSPNNIFSSYISEVLPQLGEDNLVETTFAQIARAELKKTIQSRENMLDDIATNPNQDDLNEISYKSSYEYLDDLLRFLKGAFLETYSPADLNFVVSENLENEKEVISFPATQTKELFFKTFKGQDLYERINKIAWQYAMYFTEKRHYSKEQHKGLQERFKKILYKFLPIREVERVFEIFMAREGFKKPDSKNIKYMDKGTWLVIKHFIYGFDHDFSAKYLIIDEMQDFTPVDIYAFKKIWHCPMILLGDVNQCIEKNVTDEYLQLTADFLGCKLIELKKTYRSTKQIALFANHLVGLDDIEFVNRNGDDPKVYQTSNQIEKIKNLIEQDCTEFEHIAIICKCNKEAIALEKQLKKVINCKLLAEPDDYEHRILIATCATAKGIEFDAVIIPNADKDNYHNTIDKNIIYVSSTRALHKLFFVTQNQPSTFLNTLKIEKE